MAPRPKYTCEKCGKTLADTKFFTYKDGTKCEICKPCITMHVDNFDPDTFTWILKKFDVPYIPNEWQSILDKEYVKKNGLLDGMSVLGKYISKMKLVQWKKYGWEDTEELMRKEQEKANGASKKIEADKVKKAFERGEITEAEYRTYTSTLEQKTQDEEAKIQQVVEAAMKGEDRALQMDSKTKTVGGAPFNMYNEKNFVAEEDIPDLSSQLTKEDKEYLLLKWGRMYTPNQWIELEKKYNEMMESFDIQDSDSISTLILICKTYLKTSEALDVGDYDAYTKLAKVYNDLRKTSKFTASQSKEKKQGEFDAVGQIVSWCEQHGGEIPKFQIDAPLDVVDVILMDMKAYVKNLFTQDTTMGNALETYLQKKEDAKKGKTEELTNKDYEEFAAKQAEMMDMDDSIMEEDYGTL